jgi:uncharacterized protein YggT (Ycf19 family)
MARIIQDSNGVVYEERPRNNIYYATTSPVARLIWTVLGIVNLLLGLRFLLRLFSANTAAAFTDIIYNLSAPFLTPFTGVIRSTTIAGAGIWEWSTLLAMAVYWFMAYLLVKIVTMSRPIAKY